ncbi:MAG: benzoyl-CoA reductase subunit D [Planctomycetota bacterium]|nr:benzoyl-CoA reductase subunit D [Planctomycetota bacterium]
MMTQTNPSGQPEALLTAGIDVGSSAIKIVVLQVPEADEARLLASRFERIRRRDPLRVAQTIFAETLAKAGIHREDLAYVATTGEGDLISFRTGHFYGMTAHARGGLFLDPQARAVIDIGALHTRAMLMDEHARVLSHRMTSQCASGTGQFLENIGRYLGVTLLEIGPLSLQADHPEPCSSICAVLAETDVINMVSRGITISNILKGIHTSMAGRCLSLLTSLGSQGVVMATGGLAADVGLLSALREAAAEQGVPLQIRSHENSALAGALGAALWGAFRARKLAHQGLSLRGGGLR